MAPTSTSSKLPSSVLNTDPSTYASGGVPLNASDYAASPSVPSPTLRFPAVSTSGFRSKAKPAKVVKVTAKDGVETVMHCWSSLQSDPKLPPILFIPGAAVDHQIFALPTIDTNAVDYFLSEGYSLYIITLRIGKTEIAKKGYTIYDARLDINAAMMYVRSDSQHPEVYCIAHCAGSVAFSMGLLDGTIPAGWVKGMTASQVFFNPKFAATNQLNAGSPISLFRAYKSLFGAYKMLSGDWYDCASPPQGAVVQRVLDQLLRFYPVGPKSEKCVSTACHRTELVFGRLWTHRRLNDDTHDNLPSFLGGISMNCLEKLMQAGTAEIVYDNKGESLIIESNLARLEGVPILFLHGSENDVFAPESTETSKTKLWNRFGGKNYDRQVIPGYGHLDCWAGKDAYKDVFPRVGDHIKDVMRATDARNKHPSLAL